MDTSVYGRTLRLDAARSRVRTPGAVSQSRTDGRSIDRRTAGLDGNRPFGDLAGQQPGEIIRAAAHRLDDRGAQAFQPLAHPRRVQRLAQSRAEAAHDRLRRAGGEKKGGPNGPDADWGPPPPPRRAPPQKPAHPAGERPRPGSWGAF